MMVYILLKYLKQLADTISKVKLQKGIILKEK